MDRRLPSVADRDGEYYLRQEGKGLLIGAYERDMRFWAEDGTPLDFAHDLFPDDLERIEDNMMRAIDRVPAVAEAGIKRVINGPMIWSPDSNVILGPVPELRNYFMCGGIIPGFSQSAGMGLMVAEWITKGEMQYDMFAWDMARFGDGPMTAISPRPACAMSTPPLRHPFPQRGTRRRPPLRTRPPMPCSARWARSLA
jgi:dimethylglycine dehydrogenase